MDNYDQTPSGLSQRLPPSNTQAEQALLGALLANNKAYERVSDFLTAGAFRRPDPWPHLPGHRPARARPGQLADAVMLKAEFEHSGVLEEVGGTAYLAQLLTAMVGIINAGDYGRAIHDAWLRRQLDRYRRDGGQQRLRRRRRNWTAAQQIEAAEQALFDLATQGRHRRRVRHVREGADRGHRSAAKARSSAPGTSSGLDTGLRDLDKQAPAGCIRPT